MQVLNSTEINQVGGAGLGSIVAGSENGAAIGAAVDAICTVVIMAGPIGVAVAAKICS